MRVRIALFTIIVLFTPSIANAFFDDFNDGDISDGEPRCAPGVWQPSTGMVYGNTGTTPAVLAPVVEYSVEDCEIEVSVKGTHAHGMIARLTDGDTGVIAYVSPDHDVARITIVSAGGLSTILSSMVFPVPDNEWLDLTFILEGPNLTFHIHAPSTGDTWTLTAVDPNPQPGQFGLLMGHEPGALWDWISVDWATGVEEEGSIPVGGPDLQILPNPFHGSVTFNVSGIPDGPHSMEVYDLSGRLLASPVFEVGGSERSLLWDGRCSDGSTIPAGIYITRLQGTDPLVRTLVKL